jgi:hypothetical protein
LLRLPSAAAQACSGAGYALPFIIMLNNHPSGLTAAEIAELRELAARAAEHSYSPYSRFRVGAAILLTDGTRV